MSSKDQILVIEDTDIESRKIHFHIDTYIIINRYAFQHLMVMQAFENLHLVVLETKNEAYNLKFSLMI